MQPNAGYDALGSIRREQCWPRRENVQRVSAELWPKEWGQPQKVKAWANLWETVRYAPEPYPGRLDLFLTEESLRIPDNSQLGWRELALRGAQLHELPGMHATLVGLDEAPLEESQVQALAVQLRGCIDSVLSNG